MANCKKCGVKIGLLSRSGDFCPDCAAAAYEASIAKAEIERQEQMLAKEQAEQEISAILLTTETAPNLNVIDRKKVIVAAVESTLDARIVEKHDELVRALKAEAHSVGANAVVGVTFNVVETYAATIGVGELKRFKMVAFGTAVVIEGESQ